MVVTAMRGGLLARFVLCAVVNGTSATAESLLLPRQLMSVASRAATAGEKHGIDGPCYSDGAAAKRVSTGVQKPLFGTPVYAVQIGADLPFGQVRNVPILKHSE